MGDLIKEEGIIRTDLYCNECENNFIAELDLDIEGNHIIECPHCGHEHCRVVKKGKVTSDRWNTKMQRINVKKRSVWKHSTQPIITSTASAFLRDKWLNFNR